MSRISDQRRQEILQAAAAEFSSRGVEGASMSEIAERAGIGKSTIYEYFPSKAELFAEVCQQKMLEIGESVRAAFAQDAPFRVQLADYCSLLLDLLENVGLSTVITLLLNSPSAVDVHKSVCHLRDYVTEQIEQAIRRGQTQGELSTELDVELAACYLVALPNPHLVHQLREQGKEHPVEQLVELALNGLCRR